MTERKWHSGPPPHVGWWNASVNQREDIWRWWNGFCWSHYVTDNASPKRAGLFAKEQAFVMKEVYWTDYWPENARVPRIKP